MNLDANKIINIMSSRFAQKTAQLENEVSVLIAENQLLREENEKLKEGTSKNENKK